MQYWTWSTVTASLGTEIASLSGALSAGKVTRWICLRDVRAAARGLNPAHRAEAPFAVTARVDHDSPPMMRPCVQMRTGLRQPFWRERTARDSRCETSHENGSVPRLACIRTRF